jgi:uncharacterized protein (TIGR02186 family)
MQQPLHPSIRFLRFGDGGLLRLCLSLFFLLFFCASPALAKPIIADMSEYKISINSDFTGKRLLLFGSRNDAGDVVVVVRGPLRDITIHKKARVGGMWINSRRMRFNDIPYFYAITGTRPMKELAPSALYQTLGIGIEQLRFTPTRSPKNIDETTEFRQAFIKHQQSNHLYQNYRSPLTFMGSTLFKTVIPFPDTLPRGNYAVDIYLFADGVLQSMQSLPIQVVKVGFDAFVSDAAHQHAWLYGMVSVLIAVGFGWLVNFIFTKVW